MPYSIVEIDGTEYLSAYGRFLPMLRGGGGGGGGGAGGGGGSGDTGPDSVSPAPAASIGDEEAEAVGEEKGGSDEGEDVGLTPTDIDTGVRTENAPVVSPFVHAIFGGEPTLAKAMSLAVQLALTLAPTPPGTGAAANLAAKAAGMPSLTSAVTGLLGLAARSAGPAPGPATGPAGPSGGEEGGFGGSTAVGPGSASGPEFPVEVAGSTGLPGTTFVAPTALASPRIPPPRAVVAQAEQRPAITPHGVPITPPFHAAGGFASAPPRPLPNPGVIPPVSGMSPAVATILNRQPFAGAFYSSRGLRFPAGVSGGMRIGT